MLIMLGRLSAAPFRMPKFRYSLYEEYKDFLQTVKDFLEIAQLK